VKRDKSKINIVYVVLMDACGKMNWVPFIGRMLWCHTVVWL